MSVTPDRTAQQSREASSDRAVVRPSLESRIYDRISSRLGHRVRNLSVQTSGNCVEIDGECSTFYSKQLAQEIALGVVEDEMVFNRIEVTVSR